jgi:hypothetical protein
MRRISVLVTLALLCAACSGPSGTAARGTTPPGCGLLPESKVVGLVGADTESTGKGSVEALRTKHVRATCRTKDRKTGERYVRAEAFFHPKPFELPKGECSEGWVYAGTPEKYTPACQQFSDGAGTTELIVRWQPYVMKVTIGRPDRDWGGDPERALAMTRVLAQHLGVAEAKGDG